MSYKLKLSSPGGETRRLTYGAQPSWADLEAKIASLFGIQNEAVAVSYVDSDGDVVTMSSQEELQDYFQTCYKPGQVAKLSVIDKMRTQRPAQKSTSPFVEDLDEAPEGGLPTMGPTMFIEVDDGGWQRLPRIPEIFDIAEEGSQTEHDEGHAFVEVLDSDAASLKKSSVQASPQHTPNNGISSRQSRHKGKEKASPSNMATRSTSSVSVVDDDFPTKPAVHVYDVSDYGKSPLSSVQGLPQRQPGVENLMGSFGTVYPASPPQDAFKQIPRASDVQDAEEYDQHRGFSSVRSEPGQFTQHTRQGAPSLDLEDPPLGPNGTGGSLTPTLEQSSSHQPSFVHDVANLVDGLTGAFASHPELSEGVRNIVRNAVGGRYWNIERDRVASIKENVRVAAEETASRMTEVAGNMANNAERDAVRMIAEALGGVFRVIGELSDTVPGQHSTDRSTAPAVPPPPPQQDLYSSPAEQSHQQTPGGYAQQPAHGRRHGMWEHRHHMGHRSRDRDFGYRPAQPGMQGAGLAKPQSAQIFPQPQQSNAWGPSSYNAQYSTPPVNDDVNGGMMHSNLHETKAQLEEAKAVYKAEKERFRQEKEERRRLRHEIAQKRAEEGRTRADGTIREEEIIARLPLYSASRDGPTRHAYAEIYGVPPHSSSATASFHPASRVPSFEPAQLVSPRASGAGASFYSTVDPIPPIPPAPIPAPVTVIPPAPPAPPMPPAPPLSSAVRSPNVVPPAPVRASNSAQMRPAPLPPQAVRTASAPGPFPWPAPPVRDPSRRKQLTTLRERILARLFDMGITTSSQHDLMDILNECAARNDAPDDDEVLADVLSAMNIRGSPSPRVGGSGLPY